MNNHSVRKRTFYFRFYADTDTVLRQPDRWVQAKPQRKGGQWPFFQRRINAGTDTFIAVSRPVGAGKTITKGRPMAALTTIDFCAD